MEPQLIQFKQKFIEEAAKLLEDLERDLMQLEKHSESKELIESVFRCMHTLKGTCSMYGFDNVAEITHHLESVYDLVRYNELSITPEIISLSLLASDYIQTLLSKNDVLSEAEKAIQEKILTSIRNIMDGSNIKDLKKSVKKKKKAQENTFVTWQITFNPDESIIHRAINLLITFRDLLSLGTYQIVQNNNFEDSGNFTIFLFTDKAYNDIEEALIFIMDYCKISKIADFDIFDNDALENHIIKSKIKEQLSDEEFEEEISNKPINNISINNDYNVNASNLVKSRIGVEAAKLDELMFLVSELIITNSQLSMVSKSPAYKPLNTIFEKIDKLSKQFRNNTLSLRLVPINDMMVRFQRLVRDLSVKLGKDVELITQGTEIELDKNTIDALVDPLMHIIRNCIDHGIESPEDRESKGKSKKGAVKITAYHSGNFVFIQVQDDGRGIDPELIRNKAIEKGFITEQTQLSQKEILELIFAPGFSTAQSLTEVSGRGVGMDVVKRVIGDLRGQIEISSEINLGSVFTIKLQQTIAILDTMLFRLSDMFFMVPLSDVEECRLIDKAELEQRRFTKTLSYAGRLIPFIDLYSLFQLKSDIVSKKARIIIINHQEEFFAIATDSIIGEHQAVLKSLGNLAKRQSYISLASMLGDGNLAYLLDLNSIQNLLTSN